MSDMQIIPGVSIIKRTLPLIFLCDKSTSMAGERINAVNQAIPAAVHDVQKAMLQHPEVQVKVSVLTFGSDVSWHIGPEGIDVSDFKWEEIVAGGKTCTGAAINALCDKLDVSQMDNRGYPPVCILISDGYYSDKPAYYKAVIERLNKMPWGKKAIRLVIAIGNENDYDEDSLVMFSNQEIDPIIKVQNYIEILKYIKWASVAISLSATQSKSSLQTDSAETHVRIPKAPSCEGIW